MSRQYYGLSNYANYFLRPQDAKILAKGNGKKLHEIYRDVSNDPRIYAALTQRFGAAIGREVVVEAASDRRIDKKAADEVRRQLNNLGRRSLERSNKAAIYSFGGFENATLTFLDARFIGYSVVEIDWAVEGDAVVARQLWTRDSSRFTFEIADGGWELRLLTTDSPLNGISLPPKKFLVTCANSPDDSPYGDGLANKLFWLSWLKRQIQKWWAIFCDKHGTPTMVGKYTTPNQRDRLLEAMQGIAQSAGIALPEGAQLDLLQASSTGTDVYSAFCGYCDTQAVEAILLQNLTTNITGGSYAASETHLEIREELVDADCALLSDGPYKDLSEWITGFNYPDAIAPLVYRPRVKVADEARARRDTALVALVGRPLSENYLHTHYDAEFVTEEELAKKEEEQAAKDSTATDPNADSPFVFSEAIDFKAAPITKPDTEEDKKDPADLYTEQVIALATPIFSEWLSTLEDHLFTGAENLSEVRDRIDSAFGEMDSKDFAQVMSEAMQASYGAGRYGASQESELASFQEDTADFARLKMAGNTKQTKTCNKGYSCGYSCINRAKACKSVLPGQASDYASWLAGQIIKNFPLSPAHKINAEAMGLTKPIVPLTPVSAAFTITGGTKAIKAEINAALGVVDSVHSDGELPQIPIKINASTRANGGYAYSARGESIRIEVSSKASDKGLTLAHEAGHFMDHQVLGEKGTYASHKHPDLEEWRNAVSNSKAYQNLAVIKKQTHIKREETNLKGETVTSTYRVDKKYISYLERTHEAYARSYSQYIAVKSGDSKMLDTIRIQNKSAYTDHWDSVDFKPIEKAFDNLFKKKGWIK